MKNSLAIAACVMTLPFALSACGNCPAIEKVAEYPLGVDGCSAIAYSGQRGCFYVLQDHASDAMARIFPLAFEIDPATGAITNQSLGAAVTPAGRRDAEGLAFDSHSGTLWISDETAPPSISEFALDGSATGRAAPVSAVQRGKMRPNLSLESLTISPDGLSMWTANEQALSCDGPLSVGNTNVCTVVRLTRYTRPTARGAWAPAGEWAYACDRCEGSLYSQSGLSDLCALPDGSLLALEREISTMTYGRCRIYRVTADAMSAATEVSNYSALTNATFTAVAKGEPLLSFIGTDVGKMIVYEGIALGPKLNDGSYALYLVSDGGEKISRTVPVFGTITAKTASRICALKLTGQE